MSLGKHAVPFSKLWEVTQSQQKHCSTVYYHPCCDIWTTKNSRTNRVSHSQFIAWRDILHSLPSDCTDAQQGLEAKMIEEGWSLHAIVNKPCKLQPSSRQEPSRMCSTTQQRQCLRPFDTLANPNIRTTWRPDRSHCHPRARRA